MLTTLLPEVPDPATEALEWVARPLAPVRPSGHVDADPTHRPRRRTAPLPRAIPCTATRPAPSRLRLTTRGRVVVGLLWMVIVVVAGMGVGRAGEEAAPPVQTRPVVVAPGDTLWRLAVDARPDVDPRETITQIVRINDLGTAADIHPGDELLIPSG